jgi:hypothetical protein
MIFEQEGFSMCSPLSTGAARLFDRGTGSVVASSVYSTLLRTFDRNYKIRVDSTLNTQLAATKPAFGFFASNFNDDLIDTTDVVQCSGVPQCYTELYNFNGEPRTPRLRTGGVLVYSPQDSIVCGPWAYRVGSGCERDTEVLKFYEVCSLAPCMFCWFTSIIFTKTNPRAGCLPDSKREDIRVVHCSVGLHAAEQLV